MKFPTDFHTLYISGDIHINLIHENQLDSESETNQAIWRHLEYTLKDMTLTIHGAKAGNISSPEGGGTFIDEMGTLTDQQVINLPYRSLTTLYLSDQATVILECFISSGLEVHLSGSSKLKAVMMAQTLWLRGTNDSRAELIGNAGTVNITTQGKSKINVKYLNIKFPSLVIRSVRLTVLISKEILMNSRMIPRRLKSFRKDVNVWQEEHQCEMVSCEPCCSYNLKE